MAVAFELIRNLASGAGSAVDLGGALLAQMQISATAYGGSAVAEFVVEWTYYDKTSGPWETILQTTVAQDAHKTVRTAALPVPGFFNFVRARVVNAQGGAISVKLYAE
jgi:hypothetical protein